MPNYTAIVEDLDGVKQGDGPIETILSLTYNHPLSQIGEFVAEMPTGDEWWERLETINHQIRFYVDGEFVFLGILETKNADIATERIGTLSGPSKLAELTHDPAGELDLDQVTDAVDDILSGSGWGLDPVNGSATTTATVYGRTVDESRLGALSLLAKNYGENFIYRPELSGVEVSIVSVTASSIRVADPSKFAVGLTVEYTLTSGATERNTIQGITSGGGSPANSLLLTATPGGTIDDALTVRSLGDRMIIWLGTNTPDSGIRAVAVNSSTVSAEDDDTIALIASGGLEVLEDAAGVWNKIKPFGVGMGSSRLDIRHTSYSSSSLTGVTINAADRTMTYSAAGYDKTRRYKRTQWREIGPLTNSAVDMAAASDALCDIGAVFLRRYAPPYEALGLRLAKMPSALRQGQTIRVQWEDDQRTIDGDRVVMNIKTTHSRSGEAIHSLTTATVDRWPQTDGDYLSDNAEQGQMLTSIPQLEYSRDTIPYREIMDSNNPAVIYFWLGDEVAQVAQALLRFRVDALRSPIKTVAGSASFDIDIPDHEHVTTVNESGGIWGDIGITAPSSGISFMVHNVGGGGAVDVKTNAASGAVTATVDLSSAISAPFGVYDEDADNGGTNTLAESDLEYKISINGGTSYGPDLGAGVGTPVGGWYTLDLDTSNEIADADGIPVAQAYQIKVSTATTGKYATITAQLLLRTVDQNIATI